MLSFLNPYFIKVGIDKYIANSNVKGLLILGGIMAFANVVAMVCAKYRILMYGLRLLNAGEITIGGLVAFTSYISMFGYLL